MRPRIHHRLLIGLAVFALIAAACGQKDNVAQVAAGSGSGGFDSGSGAPVDGGGDLGGTDDLGDGSVSGPAPGGGTTGGDTGGGTTGGDTGGDPAAGGDTGGGAAPDPGAGGGGEQPQEQLGNRPGIDVDNKVIRIGVHAPVTGAAPIPQSTFEEARDDYWLWLSNATGGVFGKYKVEVFFEDDEFNPNVAVQRCRKMVEQNDVFMLIGGGGADQITACAQYANGAGVPYLSAGVNEDGLAGLKGYFALSMSYAQQSPMLSQLAKGLGTKVGIAVSGSKSFQDAHASIVAAMQEQGLEIVYNRNDLSKSVSAGEGLQIATDMNSAGVEVAYMLMSPTSFITIAQAGNGQGYVPKYIGPGITSGLNTVASVACPAIGEARFLSPFMGLDVVDQFDPDFKANSDGGDDLALALWGLNQAVHGLFEAAGENMTRASFIGAIEQQSQFSFKVFNPLVFTSNSHLGGQSMHLLRADCGQRVYVTQATFANGF